VPKHNANGSPGKPERVAEQKPAAMAADDRLQPHCGRGRLIRAMDLRARLKRRRRSALEPALWTLSLRSVHLPAWYG
jgi:hypothetical protein